MEKLHEQGKVRAIGVSNFNLTEMEELLDMAKVKPAVLQVSRHV
jgi:diketogulonate reductase-like aldo/keto reductase